MDRDVTAVPPEAATGVPGGSPGPVTDLMPREFLTRSADEAAPGLLGWVLEHDTPEGLVAVILTEVEAYAGESDPASHAYRGKTARNAVMFGPPGHAYVYFTYGMHFCVNVVCRPAGAAAAVLLRAGHVIAGAELAAVRRASGGPGGRRRDSGAGGAAPSSSGSPSVHALARGPARLCQALAIDRSLDGADLCDPASPLRLRRPSGIPAPAQAPGLISTGPRVGVRTGAELPWRFWLAGAPSVSLYRPHTPRRRER